MKEKINKAQCALPLFTCLHVKPDVSELMFAGMFSICVESFEKRREMCVVVFEKLPRIIPSCNLGTL